jgi:hypothetical protein
MRVLPLSLTAALALGAASLLPLAGHPAYAGLGGTVASVEADRASMKGQLRTRSEPGYSVQEITGASGTLVREFVSPAGVVFAVSWSGPAMPNLQQALGTYFSQLQAAVQAQRSAHARRGGHNHLAIRQPDFVLHAGGHMRQYFGIAYVPSLVPPNLSISDLH